MVNAVTELSVLHNIVATIKNLNRNITNDGVNSIILLIYKMCMPRERSDRRVLVSPCVVMCVSFSSNCVQTRLMVRINIDGAKQM